MLGALLGGCSRVGTPMEVDGITLLRSGFMTGFPTAAQREFVEELVGPLPEQCPSDTYWLASGARRGFIITD